MDALLRRLLLLTGPVAALAAGSGCSLFDRDTDRRVHDYLKDESALPAGRGQAPPPEGPVSPTALPVPSLPVPVKPPAPVEPIPSPTEAPPVLPTGPASGGAPEITPVGGPIRPVTTVVPVDAKSTATDQASRVKVVATIGGAESIITDEEVSLLMKQRASEYFELKGEERERKEREVYRDCLRMLIERELVLTDFLAKVKKNKPGVLPDLWEQASRAADNQIREMRKQYKTKKLDSEADFAKELDAQGLPYKLFRRQIERASLVSMFLGTMIREKHGNATLAQVQEYYTSHKDEYKTVDKVKYLDLFVSAARFNTPAEAKKYADDLFQKGLGGADFVGLVKQFGHGDSPLRDGAGVGEKRGEIQPAALEATVFDLKPGNISGVIPTETGYHILKVTERQVAGYRPFDEKVQSEIRNKLIELGAKTERDKLIAELWRKIGVTIEDR